MPRLDGLRSAGSYTRIEGLPDRCELPRDLFPLGGQDAVQPRDDVAADVLGCAVGAVSMRAVIDVGA
jgi:hypothetical protein